MNWMGLHVRCSYELRDLLLAELSVLPFSTFEETNDGLSAYCEVQDWHPDKTLTVLKKYDVTDYDFAEVQRINWNEEWEKNYDPIAVGDQLMVRAPFHEKSDFPLEIIILPKMSFGTGHHATTHLVLDYQLTLNHKDKKVLDVGCGTGVLAIMAHKQGASNVQAIDVEDWCVENSQENFSLNNCPEIVAEQKEIQDVQDDDFDIVLANITKGVHRELMKEYDEKLNAGGTLVLSGFFVEDVDEMKSVTEQNGFEIVETESHNGWARLVYRKL